MNTAMLYTSNASYVPSNIFKTQEFKISWFDSFIDYIDRKETTVKGYITCIRQFALWLEKNCIKTPVRTDIKEYKKHLEKQNYKAGTQYQYLRAVKQFFHWLSSEGLYPNISDNIHAPKISHDVHRKDELDVEALYVIVPNSIERTSERGKLLYAMYMLMSTCGLRVCELHRADVSDIITINNEPFIRIQGKGKDEKDAVLYLVKETKKAIDDYLSSRTEKVTKNSPLFIGTSNRGQGQRLLSSTISTMLKEVLVNAGYDSERITPHSIRHGFATACIRYGLDIRDTQKLMRHSQVTTTEIYIHEHNLIQVETRRQDIFDFFSKKRSEDDTRKNELLQKIAVQLQSLSIDDLEQTAMYINSLH